MSNQGRLKRVGRWADWTATAVVLFGLALSVFAGLVAPRVSAGSLPPTLQGLPSSGWIPDVPVAANAAVTEDNASVITAVDGDLYMAYQSNINGNFDIFFTQSNDTGLTWSPGTRVTVTAQNEVSPSITQDPGTGRVFIAYRYGTAGATPIYVAYSDDLVTWTQRTVLNCGVACERPRIVSEYWRGANNVQYVALAGPISANDWNVAIARSLDHGDTWSWYESGLGPADVRYQPDLAVQHGTDGVDRVFVFYRGGAAFPPTTGYVEWSTDYGASWQPRASWLNNVYSPITVAASHDGTSLLVSYSTNVNEVVWAQAPYPQTLATFNGTWDFLPTAGTGPAVAVDGAGTVDTTIAGDYNLVAHDTTGALFHVQAPVTLTTNTDWSSATQITDVGALPSSGTPDLSITTQDRGGVWYPAVSWTDVRGGSDDVYYTTPGSTGALGVTLDTNPTGQRVTFDGVTRTAPATFWVSGGLHTISVTTPQAGAPGWRWLYASWSDGGAMSHVINVTAPVTYTASFTAQVQLTVTSARGGVTGGGWFTQGASAPITVTTPQAGATGYQYRFTTWSGDFVSAATSANVVMDAPKVVAANWQTQVYLTVQSPHGGVAGDGWYDQGTDAAITATSPQPGPDGVRYAFAAWYSGTILSTTTSATVTMDVPKTVIATWQTQYYLTVVSAHGNVTASAWYPAGTVVTLRVQAGEVAEAGSSWQFTGWSGGATGTRLTANITMTAPVTVTANWQEKPSLLSGMGVALVGLIVAALAIFLILGLVMRRRRKPAPAYPPIPAQTFSPTTPYTPQQPTPEAPTAPPPTDSSAQVPPPTS